jgi:7,8-dihydropterin-6-yl-methyl-4-(beta-D-ribofuranosyl)aminobenzene 5'-phosphate synthase
LGCAHAGVVNTLTHIEDISGSQPILAVLGGMHLTTATQQRLVRTLEALERYGPRFIVPLHCTGRRAMTRIESKFATQSREGCVGARFEFE